MFDVYDYVNFDKELESWEKNRELLCLFRKIHYSIKIRFLIPKLYRIFKSGFE